MSCGANTMSAARLGGGNVAQHHRSAFPPRRALDRVGQHHHEQQRCLPAQQRREAAGGAEGNGAPDAARRWCRPQPQPDDERRRRKRRRVGHRRVVHQVPIEESGEPDAERRKERRHVPGKPPRRVIEQHQAQPAVEKARERDGAAVHRVEAWVAAGAAAAQPRDQFRRRVKRRPDDRRPDRVRVRDAAERRLLEVCGAPAGHRLVVVAEVEVVVDPQRAQVHVVVDAVGGESIVVREERRSQGGQQRDECQEAAAGAHARPSGSPAGRAWPGWRSAPPPCRPPRRTPAPPALSGAAATIGWPSSPPSRTRVSIGTSPRNGMPRSAAIAAPPPWPKISVRSPQCGADEVAHVLDHAEHRDVELAEHRRPPCARRRSTRPAVSSPPPRRPWARSAPCSARRRRCRAAGPRPGSRARPRPRRA